MPRRTKWAETVAEQFISIPLIREWVFRGPHRLDRGVQKEVCDLLIALRGQALLLQVKCQEDPRVRSDARRRAWVLKHAGEALRQIKGAIRSLKTDVVWCDHPRRGNVSFRPNELRPAYGIVLVENWDNRVMVPADFLLAHKDVPIVYFSVNDFLNVVNELRSFPEIIAYLEARASLPEETLRAVGGEHILLIYYIQHGSSFEGWNSYAESERELGRLCDPESVIRAWRAGEEGTYEIEAAADALATRAGDYLNGLPPDLVQGYDPDEQRVNYLQMQEHLCDLRLRHRRCLGQQLLEAKRQLRTDLPQDLRYAVAYVDDKPDFLYVVAAARGFSRIALLRSGIVALRGGLAHFDKKAGMFIGDRDSDGFEVVLVHDLEPSDEAEAVGQKLFGPLKISTY